MKDAVVKREAPEATEASPSGAPKTESQRARPQSGTRVLPQVRPTSSTRIGMPAARLTPAPTWRCTQCGATLAKEMVVSGQAVLKEGALLCQGCATPPQKQRNIAAYVIVGVATTLVVLAGVLLWNRHAANAAELAALKADEAAVERAVADNRYLDAKAACTNVASGYQKAYDGNVPADVAARLESLRAKYEGWLTERYGKLDVATTNTVESVLRVLPGTNSEKGTRLLSFTIENNKAKLTAVSSPRPALKEDDPQPGSSLYRDPVLAEGNGLVAYLLQNDPSLEAVELDWNEPVEGGLKLVKKYSVTRAELPELLRSSTPLAGARQMLNSSRKP